MQKAIAIIPARGGSKRVPRKNIKLFLGKPLLAHTIQQAQHSSMIGQVIVSTDDDEIASVAQDYGAEVVRRPQELATDTVSSESALLHVLEVLEEQNQSLPEVIVFLQCTSPFRKQDDIDRAITLFVEEKADSLFSAYRFNKYIWGIKNDILCSINFDYTKLRWREQDFPLQFQENGSIYVMNMKLFREKKMRFLGKIAVYEMDYLYSFQIDSNEDFMLCECIAQQILTREAENGSR